MTRVLPENSTDVLAGRYEAEQINARLNAAFWLHGRDNATALFLLNEAHAEFAKLASEMGYTLVPVAASSVEVAA